MKVWIVQNIFTAGIEEKEIKRDCANGDCSDGCVVTTDGMYYIGEGKAWHRTKKSAIAQAEKMRTNKIASLKKQISKLESMIFE